MTKMILLTLVLTFGWSIPAVACLHGRVGAEVRQDSFKIAIARNNGIQTTIIQPSVSIGGGSAGWVFPVSSLPLEMTTVYGDFFTDLRYAFEFPSDPKNRGPVMKSAIFKSSSVKVHPGKKVGPFTITPIEGGYQGVSSWLEKNGFTEIPHNHLSPYLNKDHVLLVAKITVDSKELVKSEIPPIAIRFETDEVEFPLNFERTNETAEFDFWLFGEDVAAESSSFFNQKIRVKTETGFVESREGDKLDEFRWNHPQAKHVVGLNPRLTDVMQLMGFGDQTIHVRMASMDATSHDAAIANRFIDPSLSFGTDAPVKPKTSGCQGCSTQPAPSLSIVALILVFLALRLNHLVPLEIAHQRYP